MKKISLKIDYSVENEIQCVKDTLNISEWLIKNGYSEWVKLPSDKKLSEINKNESTNYLLDIVKDEYQIKNYNDVEDTVNKYWDNFSIKLVKYFEETSLKSEDIYHVKLTKYGTGGSYGFPNRVIINFQNKFEIGFSKAIAHEIIHLSIEPFIKEYNVAHMVKERLVDLILFKLFPNIGNMRNIPMDTESINASFSKYYPNIEEVIKNI